jgi:hypothetical protein
MSLGSVASDATASGVMTAHLDSLGYPTTDVSGELSDLGPVAYVDYHLGDTVVWPDGAGGFMPVRVLAITVDATREPAVAIPEVALDRTMTL